jgi:hypothetical protein
MRLVALSSAVLAASLALSACGGGESAAPSDQAENPSSTAAAPADTLGEVTLVRDEAAAAEAAIGPDGGSVTATAADGTTFTLTVPLGALPSETTIRAVPAALEGLDFPTYTVMFEPTGLTFLDWATLAIAPAEEVPLENQFMYQLNDDATEFGAAWVDPVKPEPTILLDHFSGYGLANSTDPQRAAMLTKSAAAAEARIQSEAAALLSEERRQQLLGSEGDSAVAEIFDKYGKQYEEEVIKPRLEAAGASCAATQLALQTVLGYERQRQLLGMGSEGGTPATQIITDALNAKNSPCEREAIEKCKAARDPGILIAFWIGVERQRQLLGASDGDASTIRDIVRRARAICAPVSYETFVEVPSVPSGITIEGVICSLTEPFTLQVSGDYKGKLRFTPSSDTAGEWSFKGKVFNAPLSAEGSGSYTVVEDDQAVPQSIDFDFITTISIPAVGDQTGGGPVSMPLLALAACEAE